MFLRRNFLDPSTGVAKWPPNVKTLALVTIASLGGMSHSWGKLSATHLLIFLENAEVVADANFKIWIFEDADPKCSNDPVCGYLWLHILCIA